MWCVASAPIVPLARDLDAALGLSQMGAPPTAAHAPLLLKPHLLFYTRFPTPLLTPLLSFKSHPHFFRRMPCHFLVPLLYLKPPTHFLYKVHTPFLLSAGSLRAFPHLRHVPPGCTPLPPRGHRHNGAFLPKTQKNEHRSLGSGARFGLLSGRKRPVILMFQKPQPKKTERTSCAKRMRMNMARG